MNILILGAGGREHAMAWAVRQNPKCDRLIVAPGNAGTAQVAENHALNILDGAAVTAFAQDHAIDLVLIGPEAPLAAGVADALRAANIPTLGPTQAAAQLEASKTFTKEICDAANIPTAGWSGFTDAAEAHAYVDANGAPIVVKADGLAAGKGVTVAETADAAHAAIDALFTEPGAACVLEEMLTGEEASFFVLCDGDTALPIGTAQDHKRAYDGDEGPNTGGMGAYSPAPVLTDTTANRVMEEIIHPTLAEMTRRGTPFQGILYAGLMIENGAPKLIEYNTRLGDPEAQVLMMRLGAQALDLFQAAAEGRLLDAKVNWADDRALCVVLAAEGYPGAYDKGTQIRGLETCPDTSTETVFHAGTTAEGDRILATGGRVLTATARASTLQEAHDRAYALAEKIDWPEGRYRTDIGHRAL
ncbi:phosphoribosylamine--glycine ligase [Aestuariibius sp. 2305UL40-4]|uniref:phosphoribosylamine--glycine ligase n=1 Tax=Aestuariibius violaceus TaxID=3234132 RepID=UPI00345EBDDF